MRIDDNLVAGSLDRMSSRRRRGWAGGTGGAGPRGRRMSTRDHAAVAAAARTPRAKWMLGLSAAWAVAAAGCLQPSRAGLVSGVEAAPDVAETVSSAGGDAGAVEVSGADGSDAGAGDASAGDTEPDDGGAGDTTPGDANVEDAGPGDPCEPPVTGCPCAFEGTSQGVCGAGVVDGAGACVAPPAYEAEETLCDGKDNDCDGLTDEPCCDDGDPCTVGDVWGDWGCTSGYLKAWDLAYGGAEADSGQVVAALPDGGFVWGGWRYGGEATNTDFWLERTDGSGQVLWDRTYGGDGLEDMKTIVALEDGGFAFAGLTGTDAMGEGPMAELVRTDGSGEVLWSRTYGEDGYASPNAMVVLEDGGFALAVDRQPESLWGEIWLLRTDDAGEPLWDQTYECGDEGGSRPNAIVSLPDGGFTLAGSTGSVGPDLRDACLVRTDAAGKLLWSRTYGGEGQDEARSLVLLSDGGFVLAGSTSSKGQGSDDFWLVRTDAAGEVLWDRTYGGPEEDVAYSLAALGDDGLALVGRTDSKSIEGGRDGWLVRTDDQGKASCP